MAKAKKGKERKEKKSWIKNNYHLSWSYIKESKNFIWIACSLFIFAIIFGFFNHALLSDYIRQLLDELLRQTEGLNAWQMIIFILQNNVKNAFIGLMLGFALGIFPVFALLLNGYVVGYVSYFASQKSGYLVLLDLLPHGIFEIPALLVALGLGIKFGGWVFEGKNAKREFVYRLDRSLRVFFFIILPLLIIAAIIEGLLIVCL